MKTILTLGAATLAAFAFMPSCASQKVIYPTQAAVDAGKQPQLTSAVIRSVNSYRSNQGLSSLRRSGGLDALAQKHAEFLRQNRAKASLLNTHITHAGYEGRVLYARQNYGMGAMGENVAATQQGGGNVAGNLLDMWINSPVHRRNLVGPWTHTGVGVVVDTDGTVFAVQIFGTSA